MKTHIVQHCWERAETPRTASALLSSNIYIYIHTYIHTYMYIYIYIILHI